VKQSQGLGVGTESEIVIPPAICRLVFHLATGAYFMFVRTVVDWVPVVPLIILIYPIVYNLEHCEMWRSSSSSEMFQFQIGINYLSLSPTSHLCS